MALVDHHQSVGAVERIIGQLKQMLRHFVNPTHTNWQDLLLPIQHAMNNAFCDALGTTPTYYMFGTHPDAPVPELTLDTTDRPARWHEVAESARIFFIYRERNYWHRPIKRDETSCVRLMTQYY